MSRVWSGALDVEQHELVAGRGQPAGDAAQALDHRRLGEERRDDADRVRAAGRERACDGARLVVERGDRLEHAPARVLAHRRRAVQHPRHRADADAGLCRDPGDRQPPHIRPLPIGSTWNRFQSCHLCQAGNAYPAAPWPTRRGGATACCTRSTRARSRTPTATGSATCAASWRASTTSSGSASTGSGSTRRCRRRTTTGATTSPTTPRCTRTSARSRTSTRWSPRPAERGIRVLLDLVPNHTSDRHAWFVDALGGRDAEHRDFYVWADPAPDGGPPNNWRARTSAARPGRSTSRRGQYYLHNFLPTPARPQLVERRGPRRVRRDPALLVRPRRRRLPDRRLPRDRQGPRAARRPGGDARRPPRGAAGARCKQVFSMNRPEVHDVLRRWRALADAQDPDRDPRRGDLRARPRPADPVLRRRARTS